MKHLFVPYEIALLAKEKGFNESCLGFYVGNDLNIGRESNSFILAGITKNTLTPCPLYQQLTDWLRENHKIRVIEYLGAPGNSFYFEIKDSSKLSNFIDDKTYYKAYNKALIQALNLI